MLLLATCKDKCKGSDAEKNLLIFCFIAEQLQVSPSIGGAAIAVADAGDAPVAIVTPSCSVIDVATSDVTSPAATIAKG